MTEHILKTQAEVWDAIASGEKRFELRKNDRCFQRGDTVILHRLKNNDYTWIDTTWDGNPKELRFKIGWMLMGGRFGLEPEYVAFQLEPIEAKS